MPSVVVIFVVIAIVVWVILAARSRWTLEGMGWAVLTALAIVAVGFLFQYLLTFAK